MAKRKKDEEVVLCNVAILRGGCYHGMEKVPEGEADGRVPVPEECDLPTDGSYKWVEEEGAFFPLGHGFGKPINEPVPSGKVMYDIIQQLPNPTDDMKQWAQWYKTNLLPAQEERAAAKKRSR